MATDASPDSSQDGPVAQIGTRIPDSIEHMREHEQDPRDLEALHGTATNRSYDRITMQERSTAIFGDVYGGVHYHIRPSHAIAQLPGQRDFP